MKLKRAIAALILVCAFAAPVAAGPFEDAVEAHSRGDYQKALRLIRPLANDGDAAAQFNLGLMFMTGRGVQQDDAAAASAGFERLRNPEVLARRPLSGLREATASVPQWMITLVSALRV